MSLVYRNGNHGTKSITRAQKVPHALSAVPSRPPPSIDTECPAGGTKVLRPTQNGSHSHFTTPVDTIRHRRQHLTTFPLFTLNITHYILHHLFLHQIFLKSSKIIKQHDTTIVRFHDFWRFSRMFEKTWDLTSQKTKWPPRALTDHVTSRCATKKFRK